MAVEVNLPVDRFAVDSVIRDVAATEIIANFNALDKNGISTKSGPRDFVTVVDVRAEKALTRGLQRLLPGAMVVGEEAVHADRSTLDHLVGLNPVWIIDPLDGTGNYIEGKPEFAVIVALMVEGFIVAGWIYDPLTDKMTWAVKGQGAWREKDRLKAGSMPPFNEAIGRMAPRFYKRQLKEHIEGKAGNFKAMESAACAAHDFLALLEGRAHFASFRGNRPWDVGAGQFIWQEAGGYAQHINSLPYRPGQGMGTPLLLAPDATSWKKLREMLFPLDLAA